MTDAAPIDYLQKIADYRTTCANLRLIGKIGIGMGCLMIYIAIDTFDDRVIDYLYFGLSIIELLIGLHNRFSPSAFGVLREGILLILYAIYNLAVRLIYFPFDESSLIFTLISCATCIVLAIHRIARYRKVRDAFRDPPTDEQLKWFDDLAAEILGAPTAEDEDMVEFSFGVTWKGKKMGDAVVFVSKGDRENLVVDRHDIAIESSNKALLSSSRVAKMQIGERRFPAARMAREMLARLELWSRDGEKTQATEELCEP